MEVFKQYLDNIHNEQYRIRMREVLSWVTESYPNLVPKIAWNQPMFTDHGTFIIAFSISKNHIGVAPERVVIERFSDAIKTSGYEYGKELIRIRWDDAVDYSLLRKLIEFNIIDKSECQQFWRKR